MKIPHLIVVRMNLYKDTRRSAHGALAITLLLLLSSFTLVEAVVAPYYAFTPQLGRQQRLLQHPDVRIYRRHRIQSQSIGLDISVVQRRNDNKFLVKNSLIEEYKKSLMPPVEKKRILLRSEFNGSSTIRKRGISGCMDC